MRTTRPHFRIKHGVWSCFSRVFMTWPIQSWVVLGYGYTPREAYDDWKAQVNA